MPRAVRGRPFWLGEVTPLSRQYQGSALNLNASEHAAELSRDEPFDEMGIVLTYDDPTCELILPIRRKKPVEAEPLRAVG
jgi:hypothetical protein